MTGVNFETSDFQPLEKFPLAYRWTDSKWNRLPQDDLTRIRPLTTSKASEIHELSILYLENNGLSASFFDETESINTSKKESVVRRWLTTNVVDSREEVIVSWDRENAVLVDWETFFKYWDDFCYPGSDDVTIFPLDFEWVLFFSHVEYFEFGRLGANS